MLLSAGQLIFVASYYDYVRLRNFLKEQDVQVAALSEYAAPKEAARARSLFLDGRLGVALLTERSHFYNRARVRGVQVRGNSPVTLVWRSLQACIQEIKHGCPDSSASHPDSADA